METHNAMLERFALSKWLKHQDETLSTLRKITEECQESMSNAEIDGLNVSVVGTIFNNTCGNRIITEAIVGGHQEYCVVIKNQKTGITMSFNLATLVALARKAAS